MESSIISTQILRVWECANPTFFPTEDVYSLILETSRGFLETKGMTKHTYLNTLKGIAENINVSVTKDCLSQKSEFIENKDKYPHLKITEIKDINKYLLCLKLQE